LTDAFADRVQKSIDNAGLGLKISHTVTRSPEELRAFVRSLDAVLASPGRKKEVKELTGSGVEVIEFIYRPDTGSINLLKSIVLEKQSKIAWMKE